MLTAGSPSGLFGPNELLYILPLEAGQHTFLPRLVISQLYEFVNEGSLAFRQQLYNA